MKGIQPIVNKLLKKKEVAYRGDWLFIMAYIVNEFDYNNSAARKHISKALKQKFSSEDLASLAHAYKMKLDAQAGDLSNLLSDLKWIEQKADLLNFDAVEWIGRCQNIIYVDWVPLLWNRRDYSTAILLCAYADNLAPSYKRYEAPNRRLLYWAPTKSLSISNIRESEEYTNPIDYGCLSFQMMGSLSSVQLASAYNRILKDNPLYVFLRHKARTDKDYYNELIGTLALREENYSRATTYLSKVSLHYLKTTNIYKEGYLSRNPFSPDPLKRKTFTPPSDGSEPWEPENQTSNHTKKSNPNAKLNFARKMQEYKQQMTNGRTSDEKGLARMMYAIGRLNSFEKCWALTQYWRGDCDRVFLPVQQYWNDDLAQKKYTFLYDYEWTVEQETINTNYNNELNAALAMLTSEEAKAKAQYILNNLKTIVKYHRNTSTGRYVMTSCDNWHSWL